MNKDEIKEIAGTISLLMKAIDGSPIEPDDIIRELINLKDIRERSRFPTYPILAKNVYLRLISKYHPEAKACLDYADHEAHTLISYKGESRKEAVEMRKAPQPFERIKRLCIIAPKLLRNLNGVFGNENRKMKRSSQTNDNTFNGLHFRSFNALYNS